MSQTLELTHNDARVEVEYSYTGYRCGRVGHIDNWLPDELPELEIIQVTYKGVDVSPLFSLDDWADLEEKVYAIVEKDQDDFD